MKTNFLITSLIIVLFTVTANSQITKGNWMVGGDAIVRGYKFENQKKFKYDAEIFPKVGYFISDKFVIGTEIGVFINEGTFYSSLVPFSRYYFLKNDNIINPYIESGLGYKNISYKESDSNFNEFMYQFKVGTSIFFTNSAGLNISLNYKKNSFSFDQEISIAFGLQIHLEK